jgi:hypothetical protein
VGMEMRRVDSGSTSPATAADGSLLEHETGLCAGAIALVSSGGAPRVWLVGMRSGRELITRAVEMGVASDLVVQARWWPDEEAIDLVVLRHG